MKSIDRALQKYIEGTGNKVSIHEVCINAQENGNELINTLFKLLNKKIDELSKIDDFKKIQDIFGYIEAINKNSQNLDRKYLSKRLKKSFQKLQTIKEEKINKLHNKKEILLEISKIETAIEQLEENTKHPQNKQYDFMDYLISDSKNISYVEFTFKKLPYLVNIKDNNDITLFHNIIKKILQENDEEQLLYYINLLSLIKTQKEFKQTDQEKKKILEEIYKYLQTISINKKLLKRNKDKIKYINIVKELIKEEENTKFSIETIASKYNIPIKFDEYITGAISLIPEEIDVKDYPDYNIIQDEYIISIDGDGAIEIDDALSCKKLENGNYLLGVHIASVLGYFSYGSEIIKEAFSRGNSIYLKKPYQNKEEDFNYVIPIFPYDFAADKGSLLENKKRLARSYYFEIDQKGRILSQNFQKSIIINNKQMTYDEANKIIKNVSSENKQLLQTLKNLVGVTKIIENKYDTSNIYEIVKEQTDNNSDLKVKKYGSENIVYQAMLLTGNKVAEFFKYAGYPCLMRVHQMDYDIDIRTREMLKILFKNTENTQFTKLNNLLDSIYPKGYYDITGRHEGLNLDCYCHCTSSLRRSQDILIEHALEVCYDKQPTKQELEELKKEIENKKINTNSKSHPIEWFAKEYNRSYIKKK